jgi:hypothetical protein
MKIESLKIEILPQPGDEFFDRLAKEFAVAVYTHFVALWRESEQQPFCGRLEVSDPAEAQQDSAAASGAAQKA